MPETFKWRLKWNHLPCRVVFEKGFEVEYEKGIKKALPFYKQAAEMGYAVAQYTLGTYYDEQAEFSSTKRDEEKYSSMAFGFYEQAAKQGYAPAQDALRACYAYGSGCRRDEAKALYWCEKAAERNYLHALKKLSDMYAEGVGCQRDFQKAQQWKQRYEAELAEHPEWDPEQYPHSREAAMAQYKKTGQKPNSLDAVKCPPPPGEATPAKPAPESKPERKPAPKPEPKPAPKAEKKPQPKAEPRRDPAPRPHTKPAYTTKINTDVEDGGGMIYYSEATQHYKKGEYDRAYELMKRAAEKGSKKAMYALGTMLHSGKGCTIDNKTALYWFEKAAKLNESAAQFHCAWFYLNAIDCAKDDERAFFWAEKSARQEYADAQFLYGMMNFNGIGCCPNPKEGIAWLRKAAEKGHKDAIRMLDKV